MGVAWGLLCGGLVVTYAKERNKSGIGITLGMVLGCLLYTLFSGK